jgi:hypothetical protein
VRDLTALATDKEFLVHIAENDYRLPKDIDAFAFARVLLPNLGSSDGVLRDELTYMILASGIIARQKLTNEQQETLLFEVLDEEHLFYRIGEKESDSVFMRSFSNLIIAAILYNEARAPYFQPETLKQIKVAIFRYAHEEKDWRGYVENKGWAHTMSHLADTLDEYAQHPGIKEQDRKDILQLITELTTLPEPLYHEEDIRLATVAYRIILGKQVSDDYLQKWIQSYAFSRGLDVVTWTRITNAKNFLRSLYFRLYWRGVAPVLTDHISDTLKKQDEVYLEKDDLI